MIKEAPNANYSSSISTKCVLHQKIVRINSAVQGGESFGHRILPPKVGSAPGEEKLPLCLLMRTCRFQCEYFHNKCASWQIARKKESVMNPLGSSFFA
jgi:hypothetical protein